MRLPRVLVALAVLALAGAGPGLGAVGAQGMGPLVPVGVSASILIEGDEGFLTPGSGVRSGSGTADDPYVLSDWTIVRTESHGVRLVNTTAHVVIQDLVFSPLPLGGFTPTLDCLPTSIPVGCVRADVHLENVTNVVIRQITPMRSDHIVLGEDVGELVLEDLDAGTTLAGQNVDDFYGVRLLRGDSLTVRDTRLGGGGPLLSASGLPTYTLENVTFENGRVVLDGPSTDVEVRRSSFTNAYIELGAGPFDRVRLQDNHFTGSGPPYILFPGSASHVIVAGSGRTASLLVCGNDFEDTLDINDDIDFVSIGTIEIGALHAIGNRFGHDAGAAWYFGAESLLHEHNVHEGPWAGRWTGTPATFRNNSFHADDFGVRVGSPGVDLRWNHWGAPDGPSGDGPGTGTPLDVTVDTDVLLEPWLTEAPSVWDGDCDDVPSPSVAEAPPLPAVLGSS